MALTCQPSLLGYDDPRAGDAPGPQDRIELGDGAWVDYVPGWLSGHQAVFDRLVDGVRWEQHRRPMYDRLVDVPRLTASIDPAPAGMSIIGDIAERLAGFYGVAFTRVGAALYRDGRDSVAWHGDQVARELPQALVATVSLGEPRPFLLRPKGGGRSRSLSLGHGDLVVMGGTCQRTWDHTVPKVARAGPRLVLMFRPVWDTASTAG